MKKFVVATLVLALMAVMFTGCDEDAADRVLTLGIWTGNEAEWASIERVREQFTAETGIEIVWRTFDDLNMQIQMDFVAGTAPDAFYVNSDMAEFFVGQGVLLPLDPATFNAGAFYQNVLDTFTFDGTIYAIPKDQSSLARYVNVGLLEQVGFTLEDIPVAAEDYLEFLPLLQAALDEHFGAGQVFAASGVYEPARILHWLNRDVSPFTEDGRANFSDPAVIRHGEFVQSLFATGAMRTPQMVGSGWNGEAFGTERVVIMEEGNWVYSFIRNEFPDVRFEIIEMPTYMNERTSMIFTVGWGINYDSPNIDLATEWIQFKTGFDGMYEWTVHAGPLPTRPDVAARMAPNLSAGLNTHIDQIPVATPWVMGQFTSIINSAFMNYMSLAIMGEMTVADAFAAADEMSNREIDFAN